MFWLSIVFLCIALVAFALVGIELALPLYLVYFYLHFENNFFSTDSIRNKILITFVSSIAYLAASFGVGVVLVIGFCFLVML